MVVAVATVVAGLHAYAGVAAAAETQPTLRVTATAKPASGGSVHAGDTITYTLSATSEQPIADGQPVVDDLSGLLDHAGLVGTPDELAEHGLTLDPETEKLTWELPGTAVGSEASTSFRVAVAASAPDGAALTTSAAPPGDTCHAGDSCATRIVVSNPAADIPTPSPTTSPVDPTPPPPTSAPSTSPTPTTSPEPSGTPTTSPTTSPSPEPSGTSTPTETETATPPSGPPAPAPTATSRANSLNRRAAVDAALAAIAPCTGASPVAGSPVAGFEIDGNLCADNAGNIDWDSVGVQPQPRANDGAGDNTQFTRGASEDNWPWSPGQTTGSGVAPSSTDMTNVYAFTQTAGDVYAYIGFERVATTGTVAYHLELNRRPNTFGPTPDRTVGDLRLTIEQQGSSLIRLVSAETWDGADWQPIGSLAGLVGRVNQAPVMNIAGTTLNPGQFAEVAIDLTQLFGPTCSGSYGTLNLRSSSSTSDTSSLNDWIAPVALDVPDTCPSVRVNKTWVIDGTTYANGSQPPGFSAALSLTGQTSPQFGVTYTTRSNGTRYRVGDVVVVGETVSPLPPGCTNVATGSAGSHTLVGGLNTFAITNTVTCTYLTLRKTVDGGSATPGQWNLSAAGPTPVSGAGNSPAVTKVHVVPGQYQLAEIRARRLPADVAGLHAQVGVRSRRHAGRG